MKSILIFLAFFTFCVSISIAQQATCQFAARTAGAGVTYVCDLSVDNPDGLEITSIDGIHLEGFTDADVVEIVRNSGGFNTTLPGVLCQRFPNTQQMTFFNFGATALNDDSLVGCSELHYLYLGENSINSISPNAFATNEGLVQLFLYSNPLTTLPEGVFASLSNLVTLDLNNIPFENIPGGAFRGLTSLQTLLMQNSQITAINSEWFLGTPQLTTLYLSLNQISEITTETFSNLNNLLTLTLYGNQISDFSALREQNNLRVLDLNSNNLSKVDENSFIGLENLVYLGLGFNSIETIRNGTFRTLKNLQSLELPGAGIRELETDAFNGLTNLAYLSLNFNNLEDLPAGIFAFSNRLSYIGLWNNRLKTFTRNLFGSDVTSIEIIDLDGNVINSIERSVLEDMTRLDIFYFLNNLCANGLFTGFQANRVDIMQRLDRCFRNFEFIVDTVTDNNLDFQFYNALQPGLVFRVQAEDEIQIALTPFNFPWSPMLEVIIGAANNTRSIIRRNQNEEVAVVPSPGIIRTDQLNLFRIVWANNVILVFRENEQWPFLVHTMIDFFNVNFYGLRTPQSRATWSVQPVDF